ncbi:ABC transporter [Tsuneonella mangrovi]|uniref:ABC transporter n=1 Tax=Tsuneonella mangrovi TaxID=1982042 RepID=UPI000BA20115|nr:ABC transporter [Tsuneonella mangrovi]
MRITRRRLVIGFAAVVAIGELLAIGIPFVAAYRSASHASGERPEVGLVSSLPVYWNESADVAGVLDNDQPPPWPRTALEADWTLVPLDSLAGAVARADKSDPLTGLQRLLLVQPRPLSPAENVALDRWVRAGGRLLLFADPWVTADSRFALGDKRRPQDVALLSPILAHWGLELRFDPDQAGGERTVSVAGQQLPVDMAGTFALVKADGVNCQLSDKGLVAACAIGKGHATIVADTALFDLRRDGGRAGLVLRRLVDTAFGG